MMHNHKVHRLGKNIIIDKKLFEVKKVKIVFHVIARWRDITQFLRVAICNKFAQTKK